MLHNYSCPVARVMVCIGAAAVVRREPSGAKRRTARLLGLMMESLGWLGLLACLWNSLSLPFSVSRCCMQLVSKTSFPCALSPSLSWPLFRRIETNLAIPTFHDAVVSLRGNLPPPPPCWIDSVKEGRGSPCFVLRRVSFVWICSMGLRNFLRNSDIASRI